VGCKSDKLKESSFAIRDIIRQAYSLMSTVNIKNIKDNEKIVGTSVEYSNLKAKGYIETKENELYSHYKIIKDCFAESNNKNNDALYILSYINEMVFLLRGEAIEDRNRYKNIIIKRGKVKLSKWVLNDFFSPLSTNKDLVDNWQETDDKLKYELIFKSLTETKMNVKNP
jgi:hypothetical protein